MLIIWIRNYLKRSNCLFWKGLCSNNAVGSSWWKHLCGFCAAFWTISTAHCVLSPAFYSGKRAIRQQHKIYTDTTNTMKLSIQALLLWVISIQHLSTKTFAHLTTNTFECESSLYDLPRELDTITTEAGFPLEMKHIYATIVGLHGGWTEGLKLYETPIVIRFTRLIDMMNWNCAAVYSVQWKDALTKTDPIIRAPEEININGKETISLHNSDTHLLCMVNAWATVVED